MSPHLEDESDPHRLQARMEARFDQPGGARELVTALAGSDQPLVVRTLLFLLAKGASHRTLGEPAGPLALAALRSLRCDDDAALANLLASILMASMHRELVPPGEAPPPELLALLIRSAARSEQVQASLVATVTGLRVRGDLAQADPTQLGALRATLAAVTARPDSLLELELRDLAPFLAEADQSR